MVRIGLSLLSSRSVVLRPEYTQNSLHLWPLITYLLPSISNRFTIHFPALLAALAAAWSALLRCSLHFIHSVHSIHYPLSLTTFLALFRSFSTSFRFFLRVLCESRLNRPSTALPPAAGSWRVSMSWVSFCWVRSRCLLVLRVRL
jgi:hypothetical protein